MQPFGSFETTSANVNLKPLKVIVNHIVEDSLQGYQARAEDVNVSGVGNPIFASWPGYVGTLSPVHFARRESGDPPGDIINKQSANLANLYLPTSARYNSSSQLSSSEFAQCSDLN